MADKMQQPKKNQAERRDLDVHREQTRDHAGLRGDAGRDLRAAREPAQATLTMIRVLTILAVVVTLAVSAANGYLGTADALLFGV